MIITREEFDKVVEEYQKEVKSSWSSDSHEIVFPVIKQRFSSGRCRYCGKSTTNVLVGLLGKVPYILNLVTIVMGQSRSICNLDCLYNYIVDRTPEILEEVTR